MKYTMRNTVVCIIASLFFPFSLSAEGSSGITIRPHLGLGNLDGEASQYAGLRLLLVANETKRYGFELTRIHTRETNYVAAGIVLEARAHGWFNASIGTIGYFDQGQAGHNYPGLMANLGWEPTTTSAFKPFVTVRFDTIFADKTLNGISLSAGLAASF